MSQAKKCDVTPTLRLVFWETTVACNLHCRHCRRLETGKDSAQFDLNTREAKQIIKDIAELGRPVLVLSGGEPLLHPEIFDIISYAREYAIPLALATNGTLIDSSIARRIKDSGVKRVAVSLDGATAEVNDSFRGLEGTFQKAVSGITNLVNLGVSTQINFTVARHNVHQMAKMFALAVQLGVDALHLFMLVPVGCGLEIAPQEMLSPEEYEESLIRFYELSVQHQNVLETRATCAPHYYRIVSQRSGRLSERNTQRTRGIPAGNSELIRFTRGCLAGISVCFISHRGLVFPCGYLPVTAGDLKQQSLKDIWEHSEVFRRLRDYSLLKGKCRECPFVELCGGCRARAYAHSGDYLDAEPFCTYQP
ncbi:radical SAM protein [Candidatus Sumerlaeota bacterium]|nr:radical SAM protein [Candidatus Sumerlaeota bacterium]